MAKSPSANSVILTFAKEKETAGAVRFQECDADGKQLDRDTAKIGTLYVRKGTFNGTIPERLTVTVAF